MSCILRISDPILKGILGKDKFNSIQELRDSFMVLADKHSVLPLDINIKGSKGNYNTQKFGKIYKEGEEVKLEIVMPGQEYFSEFEWSTNLPENFRTFYGDTDNKVLTFESIDSFLGFYLANFLYVTPSNITKLADNLTKILTNTVDRIKGIKYKHSNSIEDLKFADSLVNYSKLLYNQIGQQSPVVLDELYEQIKLKWNTYHQDQKIESNVEQQAKTNIKTFSELPQADLFFQAYDVVGGELVDKPLAKARREMIRLVEPSLYSVRLMLGSDQFIQQTNDQGLYPTLEQIEQGVVGVLVDKNNNLVYLGKDGLTTNPESAEWIEYEVEGKKVKESCYYFSFYKQASGT